MDDLWKRGDYKISLCIYRIWWNPNIERRIHNIGGILIIQSLPPFQPIQQSHWRGRSGQGKRQTDKLKILAPDFVASSQNYFKSYQPGIIGSYVGKLIFYRNLSSEHLKGRSRECVGSSYFLPRSLFRPEGHDCRPH